MEINNVFVYEGYQLSGIDLYLFGRPDDVMMMCFYKMMCILFQPSV